MQDIESSTNMPTETLQNPQTQIVKPEFGNGRYSALAEECYHDAQVIFDLEPKRAEKLARQIASDFGAVMAGAIVVAKIGKSISKDGKVTLSEASKMKCTVTDSLVCMRAMSYANECGKFGFVWKKTKWNLDEELQKIINRVC